MGTPPDPAPGTACDSGTALRDPAVLSPRARGFLLLAVFLTGATALAYEVAWTRGLVRVLGSTAVTTAVVLAAFVGALGLGARWGGARADRSPRPLLLYGFLELGAAVWAVLALGVATALLAPYAQIAHPLSESLRLPLRVLVAAIVVVPGAFLLGATLPALVRTWVRGGGEGDARGTEGGGSVGRGTAWLYGANTLGAVLGTLTTGFVGIAALGVRGWLFAAAGLAAAIGLVAALAGRTLGGAEASGPETDEGPAAPAPTCSNDEPLPPPPVRLPLAPALGTAALTGAIGLGLEIVGFRVLVFFVEGFTATFAAMLGVFVGGLGLGSLALGGPLGRTRRPRAWLGVLLLLAGVTLAVEGVLVVPGLEGFVRGVRAGAYAGAGDEASIQSALHATALLGSAALLFLPALWLGATFPLAVRWAELAGLSPGRAVGRVYAWNSVGTVLGPLLVGFVWVPAFGVLGGGAALAATCAAGALALGVPTRRRPRALAGALPFAPVVLATLAAVLFGGGGASAGIVEASHVLQRHPERRLLAARADAVTTASVVDMGDGDRVLYTDDFAAATTGRHSRYMRMLGHLPALFARDPANAMVIAFGTGTTAGAVAAHPEVKRLEVVEVSRAVLDLAPYFVSENRRVLEDPRTVVDADDGRNALLLHAPDLDLITLEPLMPYSPAGMPFYTREFYELARRRLREGGALCQWVPVHAMPAGLYAALVKTFFEVFPEGSLWFFEQSSALLWVKGKGASAETVEARARGIRDDLAAAGFGRPDLLLSGYVASGKEVLALPVPPSAWTGRVVTDLDPFPEFFPTPRASLRTSYLRDTIAYLFSLTTPGDVPPGLDPRAKETLALREGTALALRAREYEAQADWAEGTDAATVHRLLAAAEETYAKALARLPGEGVLTWRHARVARRLARMEVLGFLQKAKAAETAGKRGEARAALEDAQKRADYALAIPDGDAVAGERAAAAVVDASVSLHRGRCDQAEATLGAARRAVPDGTVDAGALDQALDVVRRHRSGEPPPADAPRGLLFDDLPPCGPEHLALLERQIDGWREALTGSSERALHLASDNLLAAARAEGLESELAGRLRKDTDEPAATRPMARAAWVCLLARLDPRGTELRGALEDAGADDASAPFASALLERAGELHLLGRAPEAARAAARSPKAEIRAAFADAAGAEGTPEMLRLAGDLLSDESSVVRTAAAATLLRHVPDLVDRYDPDGPPAEREAAAKAIRAHLR